MCCRFLSQCARWSNPYFFQFEAFALEIEGELLKLLCWFVLLALVDDFPSNPTIEKSHRISAKPFPEATWSLWGCSSTKPGSTMHPGHENQWGICEPNTPFKWLRFFETHSSISWVVAIFKDLLKLHTYITLDYTPLHSIPFHCMPSHYIKLYHIWHHITLLMTYHTHPHTIHDINALETT